MSCDDVGDGWHVGLLYDLGVGDCGGCGVEYFSVVSGFDVEYFAKALCLEGIKSVEVVLCKAGRLHSICEHGDEHSLEDLELPLL